MIKSELENNIKGLFEGFKTTFGSELKVDALDNVFDDRLCQKQKEYILGRIERWGINDIITAKRFLKAAPTNGIRGTKARARSRKQHEQGDIKKSK